MFEMLFESHNRLTSKKFKAFWWMGVRPLKLKGFFITKK